MNDFSEDFLARKEEIKAMVDNLTAVKGKTFANAVHLGVKLGVLEMVLCRQLAGSPVHDVMHAMVSSMGESLEGMFASQDDIAEAKKAAKTMIDICVVR